MRAPGYSVGLFIPIYIYFIVLLIFTGLVFSPLADLIAYFNNLDAVINNSVDTFTIHSAWERNILDPKEWAHCITPEQLDIFRKDLKSVLTGNLLGDGYINFTSVKPHFRFKQSSTVHAHYFAFIFLILAPYLTKGSPNISTYFDGRYDSWYSNMTLLTSSASRDILDIPYLASIFYSTIDGKRRKVVPSNIMDLLNPISLAIWIQDDGHYYHGAMFLNTQSFTHEEVLLLIKALRTNFGLYNPCVKPVSGKTYQNRIVIYAEDYRLIKPLISPYFCPYMRYKLGEAKLNV